MNQAFYKLRPKPPDEDWIAPLLKASLFVSTLGWIIYGVFALAFDDIAVIPAHVQSALVILGSALIVAGAEMNTAPTVVAVARKWGAGKAQPLDAVAFAVSLIGSVTAGLIAFSIRQTRLGESVWRILALNWGPLVVGVSIAADFYAAATELGLLQADYETSMAQYLEEEAQWNADHGVITFPSVPQPEELVFDPSWPKASPDEFYEWASHQNGARPNLGEKDVSLWAHRSCKQNPSLTTRKRWAKNARKA